MSKIDFSKGVSIIVSGTANWAQLTERSGVNKLSEKYQVELTLDDASKKELQAMKVLDHVNIKRQDGSLKYEQHTMRLKSKNTPKVYDLNKQIFNDLIGNGSKLRCQILIKSYEMAGKKGLTCYVNKVLVLELNDADHIDDTAFWADVPDISADELIQKSATPSATASDAFDNDVSDDDLPF
jgi:hypothetical protein